MMPSPIRNARTPGAAALAAALLALAGCGGVEPTPSPPSETTTTVDAPVTTAAPTTSTPGDTTAPDDTTTTQAPTTSTPDTTVPDTTVPPTTAPEPTTTTAPDAPVGSRAMAAAPYLYEGWGDPPEATAVMDATGVSWFTMAFMLSSGGCTPAWDGQRPLTGGVDEATIASIRGAGGDVVISFGGWSGTKLEEVCGSAEELAAAYQQVIDAYDLKAIDLDVEATAYSDGATQQRIVDALAIVAAANPDLVLYVTIGAGQNGPDASLIDRAAAAGVEIDGWTIMPFNFGGVGQDMGALSIQAADGLQGSLTAAYGYGEAEAYRHMGISSMNGVTDVGETIDAGDFSEMLAYAEAHDLARFTFWSVNRDRPCDGNAADACSGIDQSDWEFTSIIADYAD